MIFMTIVPQAVRLPGAVMIIALIACLAGSSIAADGLVTVWIRNEGSSSTEFMVMDENCVRPERAACEAARHKLANGICLKDPASHKCLETRTLAEGEVCRSDLLYEGPIPQGDRVRVMACLSPGGYAGISVRGRNWNTASHRYMMLNDGDVVKYP